MERWDQARVLAWRRTRCRYVRRSRSRPGGPGCSSAACGRWPPGQKPGLTVPH